MTLDALLPMRSRRNAFLSLARCANQAFHMVQVLFQRPAPRRGQTVFRLGRAPGNSLRAADGSGVLELARVNAEVAIGHAKELLELVEGQRRVHGQRADDCEPRALVNQAVKARRLGRSRTRSRGSLLAFLVPRGAEGSRL